MPLGHIFKFVSLPHGIKFVFLLCSKDNPPNPVLASRSWRCKIKCQTLKPCSKTLSWQRCCCPLIPGYIAHAPAESSRVQLPESTPRLLEETQQPQERGRLKGSPNEWMYPGLWVPHLLFWQIHASCFASGYHYVCPNYRREWERGKSISLLLNDRQISECLLEYMHIIRHIFNSFVNLYYEVVSLQCKLKHNSSSLYDLFFSLIFAWLWPRGQYKSF